MANLNKDKVKQEINDLQPNDRVRIRKFTPREVLRLMDVDDTHIDTMLICGISDSSIYKLAGNSIIVGNMVAIFRNIFFPENENKEYKQGEQLTLF